MRRGLRCADGSGEKVESSSEPNETVGGSVAKVNSTSKSESYTYTQRNFEESSLFATLWWKCRSVSLSPSREVG